MKNTGKIKPKELRKHVDELYEKGPDAVFNYVLGLHEIIEHLSETVRKQQEHIENTQSGTMIRSTNNKAGRSSK